MDKGVKVMSQQFVECDGKVTTNTSKKTGEQFRIQKLALFTEGESWPEVFERFVPTKEQPLVKGRYRIKPRVYVSEGKLKTWIDFEAIVSQAQSPGLSKAG
jgi:hypothetical protein